MSIFVQVKCETFQSFPVLPAVLLQVYIEPLTDTDLLFITSTMYPQIPTDLLSNMIKFNNKVRQSFLVSLYNIVFFFYVVHILQQSYYSYLNSLNDLRWPSS